MTTRPRHLWPDVLSVAVLRMMIERKYYGGAETDGWGAQASHSWKGFCDRFGFTYTEQPDYGIQTRKNQEEIESYCLIVAEEQGVEPLEVAPKGAKNLVPETLQVTDMENGGTKDVNTGKQFDKMNRKARLNEQVQNALDAEKKETENAPETPTTPVPETPTIPAPTSNPDVVKSEQGSRGAGTSGTGAADLLKTRG